MAPLLFYNLFTNTVPDGRIEKKSGCFVEIINIIEKNSCIFIGFIILLFLLRIKYPFQLKFSCRFLLDLQGT